MVESTGEKEKYVAINSTNVIKCEEKVEGNTLITFTGGITAHVKGNLTSVVNQLNND
ncbi:MAG: hypothetical protein J6M60_00990 [Clostridia bacterium]|nr:hypothetical protein [Clostridia bacterium]